jgi:putative colanic acid biosynthesis acetyltransferase WcaF
MDKTDPIDLTKYKNQLSFKNKLGRAIWFVAYWFLFRPFGIKFFKNWRNFILKCFGAKLNGDVTVAASVKIWAPWNLEMDTACISHHAIIYNVDKIRIGRSSVISHNVHIVTASHDVSDRFHSLITSPVVIEDQVWIGVDAYINYGVIIEQGAVVGARAAVFKNVPPWTIVGGNPAKIIKKRIIKN